MPDALAPRSGCRGRTATRQHPTVDRQRRARDPACLAARKEEDRLDHILGMPVPTERMEGEQREE